MDADQRQIVLYLKSFQGQFVSSREIARRAAGRKRYEREPEWCTAPVQTLLDNGAIETDGHGRYRLTPPPPSKAKAKRWLSPQMRQILERSGKFEEILEIPDENDPSMQ